MATGAVTALPTLAATTGAPQPGRSRGSVTVRGKRISWESETGETAMRDGAGKPRITMFAAAYVARGTNGKTRPVTFFWNGGPGGSTWHLREHLSPRITVASQAAPGFAFTDNIHSIIDQSDLVFIDAPGTGFSRMLDTAAKKEYWGVEEDGRAFADYILGWMKAHGREQAPIYLVAESYGGTRAGQVVRNLAEAGRPVAGVTFVSPTLSPLGGAQDWYTSYTPAVMLPPMAAVARFHGLGAYRGMPLSELIARTNELADGAYAEMLASAPGATGAQLGTMADTLSAYIGLSAADILAHRLAPPATDYCKLLLKQQHRVVDIGDGRETQAAPEEGKELSVLTPDASFDRTASIEALIRDDLGYQAIGPYARDPMEISRSWKQSTARDARTDVILADLMKRDPGLRVLLVSGLFDLVVPFLPAKRRLEAALPADRFRQRLYACGHAVYEDLGLRSQTSGDLAAFYQGTLA